MATVLPPATVVQFLAQLGADPAGTPDEFDRLQRELDAWWAAGGSCRAFVAAHQAPRTMSGRAAMRALLRKLPCP